MNKLLLSFFILVSFGAQATVWEIEVSGGGANGTPLYTPANLTINQGDEIQWIWITGQHNVTSTSGPIGFASGTHSAPFTWSFIFDIAGEYGYECTISNHSETQFGTITVNSGTQVEPTLSASASFNYFPNPALDVVNVDIENTSEAVVTIYDITGKVQLETDMLSAGQHKLDIRSLENGVYFIEFRVGADITRKRLIIK